jgi:hypothetical protein
MKRTCIILAPPLVFVLTAVLAWLTGLPGENPPEPGNAIARSPRQRAAAGVDAGGVSAVLLQLESKILSHAPASLTDEIHHAKGMEDALFSDESSGSFPGGGMGAITYSMAWAKESPEAMFAWLVSQNDKRSFYSYILFRSWAEKDMTAALAAVFKIPNLKLRRQALMSSLEILCQSDPARARELMTQNLGLFPPNGDWLVFNGYEKGKATSELLLSLPPGEERTHLLAGLLDRMDPPDAQALWEQASEAERREWVDAGFAPFMTRASSFEGLDDLMRERAESSGDPAAVEKFISSHGESWAKRDLAAALDWAQTHLKGKRRGECREKFFQVGIVQDFDATLRIWQNLPEGYLKVSAAEAIQRAVPDSRKAEAEAVLKSQ